MRAFLAFYLPFQITRLSRLPLLTPNHYIWPEPPSQKTCLFLPAVGESHPSRLQASISRQMTASAFRPPNFTFPYLPVRQGVLISCQMPARASRPDNLTFSTPRPARLTHPDRKYFPPLGCRQEPPGHPTCLSVFTCPTQRVLISLRMPASASRPDNPTFSNLLLDEAYPSDTAILKPQSDVGREPPVQTTLPFQTSCSTRLTRPTRRFWNHSRMSTRASLSDKLSFSILRPARPTQPRCRLTARPSDHLTLPSCLNPSDTVSLDLPSVAGESTPDQTTLPFLVPHWRRLPIQHSGYCAPVGHRWEPHS